MNESDSVAIERAVAGDGDGFKVLVERYSQLVFRLAYRMTGSESEAEDVVQETFLRAFRSLSSYDGRSSFSTWLYRERNLIERFFSKLKHFRRVATRYDKLAENFLAMVQLASMRLWLRVYESTA